MDRMLEKPECMGTTAAPGSGPGPPGSVIRPTVPGDVTQQAITAPTTTTGVAAPAAAGAAGTSSVWPQASYMPGSRLPWGRHQQVKILVPNCTAGLVIGKVGAYVKEIKDRTGAFIQISQKSKEINLLERCITIAGEPDQCRAAVALVLAKIAEDPQSTSCPTISYSRVQGPVASAYPTGSPFAFATLPRFPSGPPGTTGPTSSHLVRDSVVSHAGYLPIVDPYTSPVLHAALLQATALAASFNQRGPGPGYFPGACMTTSPPPPSQTQSTLQGGQLTSGSTQPGGPAASSGQPPIPAGPNQQTTGQTAPGFGSHEQSPQGPELGLYAAVPNAVAAAAAAQLLTGGGGLWTAAGGEAAWSPNESQIPGLTATHGGYEGPYPPQMNFAYYPASQSAMLASLASRHPSEAAAGFAGGGPPPAGPDFYPTSPSFAAAQVQFAPPGTTLRVTSPGTTPAQLASVYPAALAAVTTTPQTSILPMGPDRIPAHLGAAGGQTAAQAIQLGDLFGSLRLGAGAAGTAAAATPYADFSPTEFGQAFAATLSQHGLLNVPGLGAYSVLTGSVPPVSSSGTIPMGGAEAPRPPVALGPSRLIGAPAGLGMTIGPSRDAHVYGTPRPRAPLEQDSGTHYPSAQSHYQQQTQPQTMTVKRRSANAVTTSGADTNLRQSSTAEQLGSGTKVVSRAADVKRPVSCYLPPTSSLDPSTGSSAVRTSPTSEDSREETDQPMSDPSGSDPSNPGPCDTPVSTSPSRRSSSPSSAVGEVQSDRSVQISTGSGSQAAMVTVVTTAVTNIGTSGGNRRAVKHALNGGPLATTHTPNGVKK
ncbi:RNA-binding protein Nova [Fasciola gigantica]|uniref:RNA-binding protein Nova n=1 Tax=Fasciola gigantica TaxID=46835 RepID=A0A504Z3A7_FASGI|nr:RNA-binding protein Nova [Fasciola gigantica]